MSLCIAIRSTDKVTVYTDRRFIDSNFEATENQSKLFYKGDMILAFAGECRYGQFIMSPAFKMPSRPKNSTVWEYMIGHVAPAMKRAMHAEFPALAQIGTTTDTSTQSSDFIVVYRNDIFVIDGDFTVTKHNDYAAIGIRDYAIGILYSKYFTKSKHDRPEITPDMMEEVFKITAHFNKGVSPDLEWMKMIYHKSKYYIQ